MLETSSLESQWVNCTGPGLCWPGSKWGLGMLLNALDFHGVQTRLGLRVARCGRSLLRSRPREVQPCVELCRLEP